MESISSCGNSNEKNRHFLLFQLFFPCKLTINTIYNCLQQSSLHHIGKKNFNVNCQIKWLHELLISLSCHYRTNFKNNNNQIKTLMVARIVYYLQKNLLESEKWKIRINIYLQFYRAVLQFIQYCAHDLQYNLFLIKVVSLEVDVMFHK